MIVTASYIGIERGDMNYLFLLLTEDYIEAHRQIAETLFPMLTKFASKLDKAAALVRPFQGDERRTLHDALSKGFSNQQEEQMRRTLPALLIIDVDYDDFDARICNYLYVSLRDSMDEYGNIRVFVLQELLDELALGAKVNDLFMMARDYYKKLNREEAAKAAWEAAELKPGVFGVSLDLKKGIEFLRKFRQRG